MKEFVQPKMSLNSREFLIWKERGRGRERERQPGSIFKVKLGLGETEIQRDRET
jgi:hypothetical protein